MSSHRPFAPVRVHVLAALGAALLSLAVPGPSAALDPGSFPPGILVPLAAVETDAAPEAERSHWNPPFRLDGAGRVFHLTSWGRIAIEGSETYWQPDRDHDEFLVSRGGQAFYTDSFGKLSVDGASLGQNWIREHDFRIDDAGNVYTVKDWVGQEILVNGSGTGYEIQPGSAFDVDGQGRIAYVAKADGHLHIDGDKAPVDLFPGSFLRDGNGDYVYTVRNPPNRWRLLRYRAGSGQIEFLAMLPRRDHFAVDAQGRVLWSDFAQQIHRDGTDTGWRGFGFRLDGAGNVYHLQGGIVHKNGRSLGQPGAEWLDVTPSGTVVSLTDAASGVVYRDGQKLPFRVR